MQTAEVGDSVGSYIAGLRHCGGWRDSNIPRQVFDILWSVGVSSYECLVHLFYRFGVAFQDLLLSHDEDKSYFYESPFSAVKECKHFFRDTKIDYQLDENIKKIKKDLLSIDDALTIIGLGIDYKQYTKFKLLSPYINIWPEKGGRKFEWLPKDNILANSRNASFCYDFVISCALNLQRSDFEIRELLKSPFPENKDEPGV